MATGIQTGGLRRRPRSPRRREQNWRDRVKDFIIPYRNLIFVLLCVLAITAIHVGATPWEQVLGLAHGEQIKTPQTNFLVFDHITPESTQTLNRNLLYYTGGGHEVVAVQGYGLWRFGLLLTLCYALTLFLGRALLKIQVKGMLTTGVSMDRRYLILLSVLLGVMVGLLGIGHVAPTLFALVFFRVLILANKRRVNQSKIADAIETLDITRALWFGWLMPSLFTSEATWSDSATIYLTGLILGCTASYLFLLGLGGQTKGFLISDKVLQGYRTSCETGCLETLSVLSICVLSYIVGPINLSGTILCFGAFGFGRLAQAGLLRQLYKTPPCGTSTRVTSTFRILAGVWFLLPLPLGTFFAGHDQTALMIWLGCLVPLVSAGRPWGSTANPTAALQLDAPHSDRIEKYLKVLTPRQKIAILLMSLPPELAAQIFSELGVEEVHAVTLEITRLPSIDPEVKEAVIRDFLRGDTGRTYTGEMPNTTWERHATVNTVEVAKSLKNMCIER